MSVIAFALMAFVTVAMAGATVASELNLQAKFAELPRTGDSSLSPRSVNWLGGMAFVIAVLVCLI